MANQLALKHTALGAASLIIGMSFWIKNKYLMTPAFMLGWASIAYGLTDKFTNLEDKLLLAGLASITTGGMLARVHMDWGVLEKASKFGKPLFMAGWAALATAMAKENAATMGNKAYAQAYISTAVLIAGVMMIRMKQIMNKLPDVPAFVGPLVFSAGWVGVTAAAGGVGTGEVFKALPAAVTA